MTPIPLSKGSFAVLGAQVVVNRPRRTVVRPQDVTLPPLVQHGEGQLEDQNLRETTGKAFLQHELMIRGLGAAWTMVERDSRSSSTVKRQSSHLRSSSRLESIR